MSHEEFANSVAMEGPRELNKPGKIYFHDGYLFVNEVNKGVHIFDNRDPSSPTKVGFINIPANKDLAVKDDLLYADSHSDLLVFDIQNMEDAELISRKEDVFLTAPNQAPGLQHSHVDPDRGVVVDWEPVEVEEVCENNCAEFRGNIAAAESASFSTADASLGSSSGGGVGGSMARFVIAGDYLYAVDDQNLLTFDIASAEPSQRGDENVGWAIETIFSADSSLYIGSASAMYIYDISSPATPKQLSTYTHLTACDPVVVEGDLAYVTLRAGDRCPRGVNRLEVIDVEDRTLPNKIAQYEMKSPHGLGIDDGRLFISEGEHGLKIMDAEDPYNIKQVQHIEDIKTFDVIPFNNVLMVTGNDGILQYDYSDLNNVQLMSTILIERES
ncbi:MAG: LVIVD repeat-containing protein [Balneolaceae bacterium]